MQHRDKKAYQTIVQVFISTPTGSDPSSFFRVSGVHTSSAVSGHCGCRANTKHHNTCHERGEGGNETFLLDSNLCAGQGARELGA